MTTGADLVTRVASFARMNQTAASTDRALILGWLQEGMQVASVAAEWSHDATPTVVTLTSGTSQYDVTTSPFAITGVIAIDEVRLTDASVTNQPLDQVSMSALDDMRQGSQAAATPYVYAYDHPMIVIYPTPGAGSTLEVKVAQEGPTLADSASAITFWPAGLLYGVLTNYALARAMQYRRQPSWTDYEEAFLKDTNKGLPALKRWVARTGGRQPVQSRDRGTIITSPSQDMWSL